MTTFRGELILREILTLFFTYKQLLGRQSFLPSGLKVPHDELAKISLQKYNRLMSIKTDDNLTYTADITKDKLIEFVEAVEDSLTLCVQYDGEQILKMDKADAQLYKEYFGESPIAAAEKLLTSRSTDKSISGGIKAIKESGETDVASFVGYELAKKVYEKETCNYEK